ncbi:MAG: signal peptidase I [Alphaproteobacteria bacterium]|nr:signal peptidase I [Alphaproteobacteria bacterium]
MKDISVDSTAINDTAVDSTGVNNPQAHYNRVDNTPIHNISRQFWGNAMVGIASLGMILTVLLTQTQLSINRTPSLPYKMFFSIKGLLPQRGDFVTIEDHPTAYFGKISYTKRLVGFPGDQIRSHNNQLYVNHKLIGPLRKETKDGKPLHPLENTTIPEGYVFVSADHPHSFDSRYQEFGLVSQSKIWGKAIPILSEHCPIFRWLFSSESQGLKGEE